MKLVKPEEFEQLKKRVAALEAMLKGCHGSKAATSKGTRSAGSTGGRVRPKK